MPHPCTSTPSSASLPDDARRQLCRELAAAAQCDPRTAARVMRGKRVIPSVARAITAAAAARGIVLPLTAA